MIASARCCDEVLLSNWRESGENENCVGKQAKKKMLSIIETSGKEIPQNLESCYQSRGGREVVVIVLLS